MIPCEVIQDLLLLYEAGECSEESRKIIETHMVTCETCKREFERVKQPVDFTIGNEEEYLSEEMGQDLVMKSVFRKIKRRWIASILIIVLIFPTILTVCLAKNEIKKEGICFSNLDDLYRCNRYLTAVKKGDYEKAFTYLNVKGVYESLVNGYEESTEAMYQVEIDGESWYIDEQLYLNEYVWYIESGDSELIWSDLFISNAEHHNHTAIPKDKVTDAVLQDIEERGLPVYYKEGVLHVGEEVYCLYRDEDKREFYVSSQTPETEEEESEFLCRIIPSDARCIPQKYYDKHMEKVREERNVIDAYVAYYKEMGLETYIEHEKAYYLANMQKFKEEGYRISSYHLTPQCYYNEKNRQWVITVNLNLYKDDTLCQKVYEHEIEEDEVRKDEDINCASGGIIIHSSHFGIHSDNDFERGVSYIGIVEDVDNYFNYY